MGRPKVDSVMKVSQRTSEEMLGRDGKEKLAIDVMNEVSRVLGYEIDEPKPRKTKVAKADDDEEEAPVRKKSRRNVPQSPVLGVLFSAFIIQ